MIVDRLDYFNQSNGTGAAEGTAALLPGGQTDNINMGNGTTSASAVLTSFYRDLGAAGAADGSLKKYIALDGISALSAGTYTIILEGADDLTGTNLTTYATLVSGANISATTRVKLPLPENMKRFVRVKATPSGAATGGLFRAYIANS